MLAESERHELRRSIKQAVSNQDGHAAVEFARRLVFSAKPSDTSFCATALAAIPAENLNAKKLKTYLVRSVTVEPILPYLTVEAVFAGFIPEFRVGGYGSYVDELLNPGSELGQFHANLVLVLLDIEDIAGGLPQLCAETDSAKVESEIEEAAARVAQLLNSFRAASSARVVFQGIVVPDFTSLGDVGDANLPYSLPYAVQRLNQKLASVCASVSDCVFFDVDRLAARHGRARWRDTRMFLASRLATSSEFFSAYAKGLVRSLSTLFRAPRKVLCTDLDNTLWGGILGKMAPME